MKRMTTEIIQRIEELYETHTWDSIAKILKKEFKFDKSPETIRKTFRRRTGEGNKRKKQGRKTPKVLFFDIELLPLEVYTWSLWQDSIPLNMLKNDWSVLSYAAKWMGEDKIFYEDTRKQKDVRDDKKILKGIWRLIDEADIIIGHNSIAFDTKKLNARFSLLGMKPPSSYRQIDTKRMAKRVFSHTSNKLEYLTNMYCTKYKKLKHSKFPGFKLWDECLKKNMEAFDEMQLYNEYDVLSLEELFLKMAPWDTKINFAVYSDEEEFTCNCGSTQFKKNGFSYTNTGKFQRYKCTQCGANSRDKTNLLSKEKRKKLRTKA